jgi:6-pyruvoyltetrahydropterin/6-carboxytetrahydropterin synthase
MHLCDKMTMSDSIITCTRRLEFDAAHRVMLHESKCKYLHGHRYVIEVTCAAEGELDALGRVIDFGVIKARLGAWIDKYWDHNTILHEADRALGGKIAAELQQDIFYLPTNPTAENMAHYLLTIICPSLFQDCGVRCTKIRLYETPNCYAEAIAP